MRSNESPEDRGPASHPPETFERDAIDRAWMERALILGREGWGRVHPNPMVGCVIVRDGAVVGEGFHAEHGNAHAEVAALDEAGERARGATAYVSLEPCAHQGKTPPCTLALVEGGVARVVFGASDPGLESGGGGERLRAAGVEVAGPLLTGEEARAENPAFFHRHRSDRPYLVAKLAMSLDGAIASGPGERTEVSGKRAHAWANRFRAGFDAIVVGATTALVDDPRLTVREGRPPRRTPTRVVLDPAFDLAADEAELGRRRLFVEDREVPLLVAGAAGADPGRAETLRAAGAEVAFVAGDERALEPGALVEELGRRGLERILVEGGGQVVRAMLEADLVERLVLVVAPRVLGEEGVPAFPGPPWRPPEQRWTPARLPFDLGPDHLLAWDRRIGE